MQFLAPLLLLLLFCAAACLYATSRWNRHWTLRAIEHADMASDLLHHSPAERTALREAVLKHHQRDSFWTLWKLMWEMEGEHTAQSGSARTGA